MSQTQQLEHQPQPTLDQFLEETDGLSPDTETTGTIPERNDEEAARALRSLGALERQAAANTALAAAQRAKINEWETSVNEPLQARMIWLRGILEGYALHERTADDKRKTINTPFGVLKTTPKQPTWEIDEEIFIQWAEANAPELVKVVKTPEKAKLKAAYQAAGETVKNPITGDDVAGVTVRQPEQPFNVSIKTT